MKKMLKTLIITTVLMLPVIGFSQNTRDPGDPPNGGPGGGAPPVGGNAPIGSGFIILGTLAFSYASRKVYKLNKEDEEKE